MSAFGQNIKDVLQETTEIMAAISPAVDAICSFFGWDRKRAVQALADHVNPGKPSDPQIAALLDSRIPNVHAAGYSSGTVEQAVTNTKHDPA